MRNFKNRIAACFFLFVTTASILNAQVKGSTAEMDKSLKKGVYGGTYTLPNGNIGIFFQEKGELAAYEFDENANFLATHQENQAITLLNNANLEESSAENLTNAYEIQDGEGLKIMYPKESWGSLKLVDGLLYLSSTDKFINGFEVADSDTRKLKIEGTWKTTNIGARAIIPKDKTLFKFKAKNGRYMKYDFTKAPTVVNKFGHLQSAGIITEKISIRNPSEHNANRLVVFKVGFDTAENSNIHVMPYSMRGIGVGNDSQNNMVIMTVPLNAPSTYGPHKKLNAKDEDRSFLYLYRFDHDNNLIDEQKIKSDLGNVNGYQTLATANKTYLIGTGKAGGKGFISSYPGQKTDAISIAVMDVNGKLSAFKTYSDEGFEDKLENMGEKSNMKFAWGPYFYSVSVLDNGNVFFLGKSAGWHHGILLSPNDELIRYYTFPHLEPEKYAMHSEQLYIKNNKIYLLLADQPHELTNEKKRNFSSHGNTGYTSTSQLFEIFHLSNVFLIDGTTGNVNKIQLNKEVKNFYTLGNNPALFTDKAIYIPGRIKANKGKEVSLIKIDY